MLQSFERRLKNGEKNNIMIRLEKKEEHQKVENLVRKFWNVYCQDALSIMYCISSEMIRHLFQNWIRAMVSAAMKQIRNLLDDYLKWFCEEMPYE